MATNEWYGITFYWKIYVKGFSISDPHGNPLPRRRYGTYRHGQAPMVQGGQETQQLPNGMIIRDGVVYTQLTAPPPHKKQKTGK